MHRLKAYASYSSRKRRSKHSSIFVSPHFDNRPPFSSKLERMKHTLTPQRYLILLCVMLTASVGDTLLARGMTQVGPVSLNNLGLLFVALKNPWVISGI